MTRISPVGFSEVDRIQKIGTRIRAADHDEEQPDAGVGEPRRAHHRLRSSVTARSEKAAVTRTSRTAAAAPPGKSKTVNICR